MLEDEDAKLQRKDKKEDEDEENKIESVWKQGFQIIYHLLCIICLFVFFFLCAYKYSNSRCFLRQQKIFYWRFLSQTSQD